MNGAIRKLAAVTLVAFLLLVLNVTFVQALAGPRYRDDPRNTRVVLGLAGKERGSIVTRDNVSVAESVTDEDDPRRYSRRYLYDDVYAHTVGFTSLLFGDTGIEATYAQDLRSRRDLTISDLISALLGRDLRAHSLQLTLDHRLQTSAYQALEGLNGSIVALDPRTGEMLAFASRTSFDPNTMTGADAAPNRVLLLDDPDQPLLNRGSRQSYPPGSTFKVITAAAALEQGLAGPESTFEDPLALVLPGSTSVIRNADQRPCGNGEEVTLEDAFRRSCNTIFGQLAMDVGAEALYRTAEAFGFNQEIPFDIGVLTSLMPAPTIIGADLAALAQTGLGQRDVQATVLQMALVAAAVANEGLIMEPRLVATVVDADGDPVQMPQPTEFRRAVSPGTALILADLMERVVTDGTATRAQIPGVRVAGKTGTAESGDGPPDVWFIGFAPVESPTIAVAVLVEGGSAGEGATGSTVAAPIGRLIIETWLEALG